MRHWSSAPNRAPRMPGLGSNLTRDPSLFQCCGFPSVALRNEEKRPLSNNYRDKCLSTVSSRGACVAYGCIRHGKEKFMPLLDQAPRNSLRTPTSSAPIHFHPAAPRRPPNPPSCRPLLPAPQRALKFKSPTIPGCDIAPISFPPSIRNRTA